MAKLLFNRSGHQNPLWHCFGMDYSVDVHTIFTLSVKNKKNHNQEVL